MTSFTKIIFQMFVLGLQAYKIFLYTCLTSRNLLKQFQQFVYSHKCFSFFPTLIPLFIFSCLTALASLPGKCQIEATLSVILTLSNTLRIYLCFIFKTGACYGWFKSFFIDTIKLRKFLLDLICCFYHNNYRKLSYVLFYQILFLYLLGKSCFSFSFLV